MLTKEIKILMDQNHNEISLHTHQDCSNKKSENDRTVEDTEKSEPLYTPNRKRNARDKKHCNRNEERLT